MSASLSSSQSVAYPLDKGPTFLCPKCNVHIPRVYEGHRCTGVLVQTLPPLEQERLGNTFATETKSMDWKKLWKIQDKKPIASFHVCNNCQTRLADFMCLGCGACTEFGYQCAMCHYAIHVQRTEADLELLKSHVVVALDHPVPKCTVCDVTFDDDEQVKFCVDCRQYYCHDHNAAVHRVPEHDVRSKHVRVDVAIVSYMRSRRDLIVDLKQSETKYDVLTLKEAEQKYGFRNYRLLRHYKGVVVCADDTVKVPKEILGEYEPIDLKQSSISYGYFKDMAYRCEHIGKWVSKNLDYGLEKATHNEEGKLIAKDDAMETGDLYKKQSDPKAEAERIRRIKELMPSEAPYTADQVLGKVSDI